MAKPLTSLIAIALLAASAGASFGVGAEEVTAQARDARFVLTETATGVMRLDQSDGTISFCEERQGKLVCTPSADAVLAYEAEIAVLEAENRQLREDLADISTKLRELATIADAKGIKPVLKEKETTTSSNGWFGPDEEEKLDQALDFTEKAMRRFFNMVEGLRQDFDNPAPQEPSSE
ncbi:hypothetical protein [Pseudovibrio sp. SPO723]|uniref:hypothetical protein n=1 Tax=Nesiotobacter zosterae TaxID=392721 RepID=UPI0029C28945|nr:hypothetical protein [Pseudovibrio sp. SPO723]MDX5593196.1 hypothetical protein [Pseudovibrio sp. SPO723]